MATTDNNKHLIASGSIATSNLGHYSSIAPNYQPGTIVAQPNSVIASGTSGTLIVVCDNPELEDLIEMLELDSDSGGGVLLQIKGKNYSLVALMKKQMEYMMRMNILLMHRSLGVRNEENSERG